MTENPTTDVKKKKKIGKDARTLMIWGFGFAMVALVSVIGGETVIQVSRLALLGVVLVGFGVLLTWIQKYREKWDQKKYDTGMLALRETE